MLALFGSKEIVNKKLDFCALFTLFVLYFQAKFEIQSFAISELNRLIRSA